jgi:hypothetical protein
VVWIKLPNGFARLRLSNCPWTAAVFIRGTSRSTPKFKGGIGSHRRRSELTHEHLRISLSVEILSPAAAGPRRTQPRSKENGKPTWRCPSTPTPPAPAGTPPPPPSNPWKAHVVAWIRLLNGFAQKRRSDALGPRLCPPRTSRSAHKLKSRVRIHRCPR